MSLRSLLDALRSIPLLPRAAGRRAAFRPRLEPLDDRVVPSFAAPVNYPTGGSAYAVVTDHLDDDAVLDLAVVNYDTSTVSVLLGNGDGTFQPAADYDTGAGPLSVAVGDFDGDGDLDLATANVADVSVLLGNGDGSFQAPSSTGIGSDPASVAVGDFNADGLLDLGVTSNVYNPGYYYGDYYYPGYYDGYANVLIGNGDGTFSGPNPTWLGSSFHTGAAVADFSGDEVDDFAAANPDYGSVNVLTSDGTGTLLWTSELAVGSYPNAVAAADLDGDADIDLVAANLHGGNVGVILGDGQGGFAAVQTYATSSYPQSVAVADFNNDGTPDIATADYSTGSVAVVLGRGDGTFTPPVHAAGGANALAVVAGDFDGDLWPDAVTPDYSGEVSVLINDLTWPPLSAPVVSINDVTVTEGNTGSLTATFTLTLSAAYGQPVTVHYATANGSAAAGSDFAAGSGDVTFAAGQTTRTAAVTVLGDRLPEPDEWFAVNLTATGAFVGDGQGVVTIRDNEPRIFITDVSKSEGNGNGKNSTTALVFTVTLSAAYDQAVTVNFATANGTATVADNDYTTAAGTLTFAPGETTKTVTVQVKGDKRREANEWFAVDLSGASSNALIGDWQGLGWILNDDR